MKNDPHNYSEIIKSKIYKVSPQLRLPRSLES